MAQSRHLRLPVVDGFSAAKWNSIIRQAVDQGNARKALLLFRQMKQHQHLQPRSNDSQPNNFTFPFLAKACAKLRILRTSQMIHAQIAKSRHVSDTYVQTALVDMYVKCGCLEFAHDLFDEMTERDVVSWNSIILGFSQLGSFERVSLLFNRMRVDGVLPDALTVVGLTQLASGMKDGKLLSAVHCFGLKIGVGEDVSVSNTWISGYAKCSDLRSAEMVFSGIEHGKLTPVSWNAMITGYACAGEFVKAVESYRGMLGSGCAPDLSTILNLLSSFAEPDSLYCGMLVHAHGIKLGCDAGITVLNTLISMYAKCGDICSARYVFDCMDEKTCVTWTVMIGGYSEIGDLDEALVLFHSMNEKPDLVTVLHLVAACGKVGALEVGRWLDTYSASEGLKNNIMVSNAFIDMYGKCGSLRDAQELFRTMSQKTIVSWTTMISAFAVHGKFQAALDHFDEMLKLGIKPNHVTYLAVLQACTHAGFLEKGWEIFNMMSSEFHTSPSLDHYACMTDLLGRKGKLKEALKFILDMPVKPDAGIWGTLLGACKIYQNPEIGEYAANQLFELEPSAAAPYVAMANIYASINEWEKFSSMRLKMRMNQVTKFPGQSVIRVDGKCRSFTVEDRCQSESVQIFEALDSLVSLLKDELDSSSPIELLIQSQESGCGS